MASYSATDKLLHKFYLGNYSISRATLEMEEMLYGSKAKKLEVTQYVFVTGLARSGTTAVMNKIFGTGEYASLQYANMPFLLSPNLWKRRLKIESHERAHKDGIIINGDSPEEFDEYFWKAFLRDAYIKEDGLTPHVLNDKILDKYLSYVDLICLAKGKDKYISKNNNNILRLSALGKIVNNKILILFRDPLSHASSLMKLHKSFTKDQMEDPFALDYFNYLGHHEFGQNHRPFLLTEEFNHHKKQYPMDSINYWMAIWLNYYQYVLENKEATYLFICFENLIKEPEQVYKHISKYLELDNTLKAGKKHQPTRYQSLECDPLLLDKCGIIYKQLLGLSKY